MNHVDKEICSTINKDYPLLESHAIIGNMYTTALVSTSGIIDFMCYPYFDSGALFCSLLDFKKGGYFKINPNGNAIHSCKQFYWPDSNILVTRFFTPDGIGQVVDYMPVIPHSKCVSLDLDADGYGWLVRRVMVARGKVDFEMEIKPTFDFVRKPHTATKTDKGVAFACEDYTLHLDTSIPCTLEILDGGGIVKSKFSLTERDKIAFILRPPQKIVYCSQPIKKEKTDDYCKLNLEEFEEHLFDCTVRFWQRWIERCTYRGRWREMVIRSALVLKLLTFAPTGAIVASPTCSLPEEVGGGRNWDYRYMWVRDAAFTLYALMRIGFTDEAGAFMNWLQKSILNFHDMKGREMPLQIMYTIHGGCQMPEEILDHLEGYKGSKPVRIGNAAAGQMQLDIFGELLDSVYLYNKYGVQVSFDFWCHIVKLLDWLSENWRQKDEGMWEVRGGRQDFVYSKVMCWVAFDRGMRLADRRSFPAPVEKWRHIRDEIYVDIMNQGFNKEMDSFVMCYGGETLDASVLIMPLVFFMAPNDPRMIGTLKAMLKSPEEGGLLANSLVFRYNTKTTFDGLFDSEGTFNICSFWLIEALTRAGIKEPPYMQKARLMFEEILTYANHVGLYGEETGSTGQSLGNFPQAFTHLSLISAAFNLDRSMGQK